MRPILTRLLSGLLAGLLAGHAHADTPAVSEHAVKAVLFYKLAQFAYLPARERSTVSLCGLGRHAVIDALDKLGQTPGDSKTPTYQSIDSPADAANCDLLFIARGEAGNLDAILARLKGTRVVTVSDSPGFAKAGGMVELGHNPDKAGVQILINRKAAQRQGIEFNAQLLRLAKVIEP